LVLFWIMRRYELTLVPQRRVDLHRTVVSLEGPPPYAAGPLSDPHRKHDNQCRLGDEAIPHHRMARFLQPG